MPDNDAQTKTITDDTKTQLAQIVTDTKLVRLPPAATDKDKADAAANAVQWLTDYVQKLLDDPAAAETKTAVVTILEEQVKRLDEQLSKDVSAIMQDSRFRKLEASWRGLHYLVRNTESGERIKLRLLNVKRDTLKKDLLEGGEDQSALFKKVYEEEYGTYGGAPFSLLLGDFEFGRHPEDVTLLGNLSHVAAAAHAPFIAAASPGLFGLDSFADLGKPRDLTKIFASTDVASYQSFRGTDDARYVTLCLPHFLLRLPYGADFVKSDNFAMEEVVENKGLDTFLWGNAAYALGARITDAFAHYGWCAAIRGPEGGGKVTGLPAYTYKTDDGDKALKCPTEVSITDRREKELDSLGFVALVHRKGADYAAFFGGQTTHKPPKFDLETANANAALSARLPYVLAVSRFAHYLKVQCRDKIGTFQTKETLSQYLNQWIMTYVLATDDAGQDVKAKFPLRDARIEVTEKPGAPGSYRAICFLRPHFQLEELTTSIRLVAELPQPAAA